jgi:hypothetical protein
VRWKEQKVFEMVSSDFTSSIERLQCKPIRNSRQQQKCPKTLANIAQDTFFSKDSQEIQICPMKRG